MKFSGNVFPSFFIPLLNFDLNNSRSQPYSHNLGTATFSVPVTVSTATIEVHAVFTHSSHHTQSEDDISNENRYANIGEDEDGVRRPRVGQKTSRVHTTTKLAQADVCPSPPILSCSAKADDTDSCCVVRPGGVLVHAQFWDLDYGVADSWGVHGLCGRKYSGSQITQALQRAGQTELLNYMNTYWVSNNESPEEFWAHEWATHGTCVSTLEPTCFEGYTSAQEVVPYFETVVQLFQQLDTYQALTSAGITPSSSNTYTLTRLQDAVTQSLGYVPDFTCKKSQLASVQYYLNAQGPLQDGEFVASHATRKSDCPKNGIKWLPKTVGA